jgi:RNA polymerase sigma-70 factor (ECF subfamily)
MELARVAAVPLDLEAELLGIYPALARRLTLVLRDASEAEDVAQTAFVKALEHRQRFTGGDARAWFYTIGLRLAFDAMRRRSRGPSTTATAEPEWALRTEPDLWVALAELDARHRAALVLSALEGYTHREIGRILEVPEGTVSSWLSRTKERLREVLGGDER